DVHHRSAEGPPGRSGPSGDLPGLRAPPALLAGHLAVDRRELPERGAGMRRVQGQPRRADRRLLRAVPRAASGARTHAGYRRGGARRRRLEGATGGRGDDEGRPQRDEPRMSEPTEDASGFAVELPVFVGPFKLLADLILDQRIDVCDVPIATITDRFLAHSKEAERWSLEEA